ncbi:hypothetical protein [Paenibacillus sp. P22]|uniref:hypothetical protein n=1 Tax=Paenibacillus sp. P22 TaxID=483908 RepID=UPI00038FF12B|nr:hypothetical protein [Paenibacillus sp. P22]CDN41444.1 hypothetical protein BN871_AH_00180 [Paenibacillus sp. P22]
MKAAINGVTIEGTPQEIAEYQMLMEKQSKPFTGVAICKGCANTGFGIGGAYCRCPVGKELERAAARQADTPRTAYLHQQGEIVALNGPN